MFIKIGWKYPVEVLCCSLSLGVLVWDRLAQVYPQIKQIFHGANFFLSAMIDELEFTPERASERERTNERTIFFINEGNGISTVLFFIQPSGKNKQQKQQQKQSERETGRERS